MAARTIVYQDSEGNTLQQKTQGVGRPPADVQTLEDGTMIVPNCVQDSKGNVLTPRMQANRQSKKQPVTVIYLDENGEELDRKEGGKGRRPHHAEKDSEGNLVVRNCSRKSDGGIMTPAERQARQNAQNKNKPSEVYYYWLDKEGNVLNSERKGRGRPHSSFTKHTEGPFQGHYVKIVEDSNVQTEAASQRAEEEVSTHSPAAS